jgi:hypothetical protein
MCLYSLCVLIKTLRFCAMGFLYQVFLLGFVYHFVTFVYSLLNMFWINYVGSLFNCICWFSCIKVSVFCFSVCLYIMTKCITMVIHSGHRSLLSRLYHFLITVCGVLRPSLIQQSVFYPQLYWSLWCHVSCVDRSLLLCQSVQLVNPAATLLGTSCTLSRILHLVTRFVDLAVRTYQL